MGETATSTQLNRQQYISLSLFGTVQPHSKSLTPVNMPVPVGANMGGPSAFDKCELILVSIGQQKSGESID